MGTVTAGALAAEAVVAGPLAAEAVAGTKAVPATDNTAAATKA
ncbi:predicted protein [Streptomyces iranensis]|uniref:Uncharacterized protein n=3 Tax=Streptomyces violaceusniger group TaxID=2839105 RepID=A0ABN1PV38_9ACTN|nr:predicted protein [Streptomyces iranensis]